MTCDPIASFSVANINPGSVRFEFMLSMMALIEKERALGHEVDPQTPRVRFDKFYSQMSGPYLDDERNRCVLWFLNETESDYLLFIDSDIAFRPDQPFDLIQTAAESSVTLLTGVYYNQFSPHGLRAVVHQWADDKELDQPNLLPLAAVNLLHFYPQTKPHEIDACGAGFLAIHRSVFTDMGDKYGFPQPYFAELVLDGIHMGEDLTFCLRAKAVGHSPYVLPSIEVDHYKTCVIRPEHRST